MKIVFLASGKGSNVEAVLSAMQKRVLSVTALGVVTDQPEAKVLQVAERYGVQTAVLPRRSGESRLDWDARLAEHLVTLQPDFVVLAGFMKIIGASMLSRFPSRILNIHPSLLPSFPGLDAPAQAVAAGVKISGCTVHLVDAGVDTGPILAQAAVPVEPADNAQALHQRIQRMEHRLLPAVLAEIARGGLDTQRPQSFVCRLLEDLR